MQADNKIINILIDFIWKCSQIYQTRKKAYQVTEWKRRLFSSLAIRPSNSKKERYLWPPLKKEGSRLAFWKLYFRIRVLWVLKTKLKRNIFQTFRAIQGFKNGWQNRSSLRPARSTTSTSSPTLRKSLRSFKSVKNSCALKACNCTMSNDCIRLFSSTQSAWTKYLMRLLAKHLTGNRV